MHSYISNVARAGVLALTNNFLCKNILYNINCKLVKFKPLKYNNSTLIVRSMFVIYDIITINTMYIGILPMMLMNPRLCKCISGSTFCSGRRVRSKPGEIDLFFNRQALKPVN